MVAPVLTTETEDQFDTDHVVADVACSLTIPGVEQHN